MRKVTCVLLLLLTAPALRAQITIASQNTKNYGWGRTNPKNLDTTRAKVKTDNLTSTFSGSANPAFPLPTGVFLLQEVMKNADLALFLERCKVPECSIREAGPYGAGSYQERYVFLHNDPMHVLPFVGLFQPPPHLFGRFVRPPTAMGLTRGGQDVMLVNFHAVWGQNGQQPRIDEAAAMAAFIQSILEDVEGVSIIAGGDWNLPIADMPPEIFDLGGTILPNVETSLNLDGDLSSSYDHFWWNLAHPSALVLNPAGDGPFLDWRTTTSDHRGIRLVVP